MKPGFFPSGSWSGQAVPMPRRTDTFVGRSSEFDLLTSALGRVADGEHALVVVSGESGIGKSRLLDHFAERAEQTDALVVRSWCAPVAGAGVAFGPVATLLREAVKHTPDGADMLRELVPDVAFLVSDAAEPRPAHHGNGLSGELAQLRLLEAFRSVLAAAADATPVVVIVEDVQWADRSSADALAYLTSRTQPAGLLVVVSYRAEDLRRHHYMHPIVTEMERAPHADRVRLEPFAESEVREQAIQILDIEPTEDLVQELADRSGGNPFFIEELIAASHRATPLALPDAVPSSLSDVLTARFDPLLAEHRGLVRVAAAIGGEVNPDLLEASTGLSHGDVVDALRAAVEAGVLAASGERLAFRHELLREAVYAGLLPGERREVHRRIAEALAADPELAPGWAAGELAFHWQEAGAPAKALGAAMVASGQAREVGALAAAARHGTRALELWDEVEDPESIAGVDQVTLLLELADDSMLSGNTAVPVLAERALALVDAGDQPARYADISARLAHFQLVAGQPELALRTITAASELVADEPVSSEKARVAVQHAQILMNCDLVPLLADQAATARELAASTGDRAVEVQAGAIYGLALCTTGEWQQGLDVSADNQQFAGTLATDEGGDEARARAALEYAFCLYWLGFPDRAQVVAYDGHVDASKHGLGLGLGSALRACAAVMALAAGRLAVAQELLRDVSPSPMARFAWFLAEARAAVALAVGDLDAAERALASVSASTRRIAPVGLYHLGPFEVALGRGQLDDARQMIEGELADAIRLELTWKIAALVAAAHLLEAEVQVRAQVQGDDDAAAAALARAEDAQRAGERANALIVERGSVLPPSVVAWTAVAEARLAELRGVPDPEAWTVAVDACESAGMRLAGTRAMLARARAHLASAERDAASEELTAVIEIADRLGLSPLAGEARDLATRARLRLGASTAGAEAGRSTSERLGVTERELQVLRLVADGLTNREIGESLFLSPKTVSVHVTNLLRKLEVPSRREAARLARRLGLL